MQKNFLKRHSLPLFLAAFGFVVSILGVSVAQAHEHPHDDRHEDWDRHGPEHHDEWCHGRHLGGEKHEGHWE